MDVGTQNIWVYGSRFQFKRDVEKSFRNFESLLHETSKENALGLIFMLGFYVLYRGPGQFKEVACAAITNCTELLRNCDLMRHSNYSLVMSTL